MNVDKLMMELSSHFSTDKEALDALEVIKQKLKKSPLDLKAQTDCKSNLNSSDLPLPTNVPSPKENDLFVFTDGACRGNPGPGAWGALAQGHLGEIVFECSGFDQMTTNNIMELTAVLKALEVVKEEFENQCLKMRIHVYSDSKYVVDGINSWMQGWKRRGWKKADKKTPENVEIWQSLDAISDSFSTLKLNWVKGHSGHPQNERVDQLANQALDANGF